MRRSRTCCQCGNAIPRLQQILESPPVTAPSEERAFTGVVMDALIQLNARVPARLLAAYGETHPVQTFVLLSSAIDREGVLLELLPRLTGLQWFAAACVHAGGPEVVGVGMASRLDHARDDAVLAILPRHGDGRQRVPAQRRPQPRVHRIRPVQRHTTGVHRRLMAPAEGAE